MAKKQPTPKFSDLIPKGQMLIFDLPDVSAENNADMLDKKYGKNFNKAATTAAAAIQAQFSQALDKAMELTSWSWPRQTLRQNGSIAGLSRNIIDTGALKQSKESTITAQNGGSTQVITFAYTAPYAMFVHEGGAMVPYGDPKNKTVILPGRPWVRSTLEGGNGMPKFDFKTIASGKVSSAFN